MVNTTDGNDSGRERRVKCLPSFVFFPMVTVLSNGFSTIQMSLQVSCIDVGHSYLFSDIGKDSVRITRHAN